MIENLSELKLIRQKLEMTQAEFAKKAGISQSMVTKIESGKIDPTFGKVKQISDAVELLQKEKEVQLKNIMATKVVSVNSETELPIAISKMKKYEISQMPVIDDGRPVGILSERNIIETLTHEKGINLVKDTMGEAPPQLPSNSTVHAASHLLSFFPLVLVSEKGKIKGLVTRADVLQKAFR